MIEGTRSFASTYSNNGSSCWITGWASESPYDCRIRMHYGIGGFASDVCNWYVYGNL